MNDDVAVYADFKRRFDRSFGLTDYKNEPSLKATIKAYRDHGKHSLFVFITDRSYRTHVAWAFAGKVMSEWERPAAFDNTTYRYCLMNESGNKPTYFVEFGNDTVTCAMVNQVVSEIVATDLLSKELNDSPVRQKVLRVRSLSGFFARYEDIPVIALHLIRDSRLDYVFCGLDFLITKGDMECLSKS